METSYPLYLANEPQQPNTDLPVMDKYTGDVVTRVAKADRAMVDRAIAKAADAAEPMRKLKAYQRRDVLQHLVDQCESRAAEFTELLCIEAGKPIKDSRGEVTRLIDTLRVAAEESTRIQGEHLPLDISARAANYEGFVKRLPIGPVSLISPWNFPLNLVAHKIGPALAAGCPFVLKPASATPLGALLIGKILSETDLPPGAFSILPCSPDDAQPLVTDHRMKLLSFTGSPAVGWQLKAIAGKKKVALELGGNAACVVDETIVDDYLEDAVARCIVGGFYQSGQTCISLQRLLVADAIYVAFRERFVAQASALVAGNPKDEDTFIGPMISKGEADRLELWINQAVAGGGTLLCGGTRAGNVMHATVLEGVADNSQISCEEAFGPVVLLHRFSDFKAALTQVNATKYGLQAGVFTRDIGRAHAAWNTIEAGSIMINEMPSWRVDHMPYGGVKDSGLGREGLRYAIEEMTEPRLMVVRDV